MKPPFQRRAFWSFAGICLLGLAGWQSVQTTLAGRKAAASKLPPLRTRSSERPLLRREDTAGDPVANYLARAKRGMTEREVRWMVEDFEAAGLDRTVGELPDFLSAIRRRKNAEDWYLAALREGFSLTPEQSEKAGNQLHSLFEQDLRSLSIFEKPLALETPTVGDSTLADERISEAFGRFIEWPLEFFHHSAFAPWNLTQLSEEQSFLTLRYWLIEDAKRQSEADPFASDQTEPTHWLFSIYSEAGCQVLIQDPTTGNLLENAEPMTPRQDLLQSGVFAFTPEQMPQWNRATSLLEQAQCCHPAQLRMALLERPALAHKLRAELDSPSSK